MLQIKKAIKYAAPLRMAIYGPAGSGKTYSSLLMAVELAGDKRVLLIDSERGSASKYADIFDFDVIELASFHPHTYIEAIRMAVQAGVYSVIIIDSMTHEWDGTKGALELAGSKFQNWDKVTPLHNLFVGTILTCPLHIIGTMRAKEKHELVTGKDNKLEVIKLGMDAIQGKYMQYEFDVVGSLDLDSVLTIQKTRCSALKGGIYPFPGKQVVDILSPWLAGESAPPEQKVAPPKPVPAQAPTTTITPKSTELYKMGLEAGLWTSVDGYLAEISTLLNIKATRDTPLTIDQRQLIASIIAEAGKAS